MITVAHWLYHTPRNKNPVSSEAPPILRGRLKTAKPKCFFKNSDADLCDFLYKVRLTISILILAV